MSVKVSVVVPVWNPGRYLNRCVDSLLTQTLPITEFEAIFVDDGSTDGTSQHLDTLATQHPHFHVIHAPHSGWPGKPRNIGIAAAAGQYIQFLDNDDTLAPQALQRLYHLGHTTDADIVIGKVTSNFRGVPHNLFRTTQTHTTLHTTPLIESLTPHKMFSHTFLDRHPDIRFPEGRRRLEDQLFMVRAYLAAKNVAILGDYPCYFYSKRDDGKNAGSERIDPPSYYANLRDVLDVVVAGTQPGSDRWRLLERFYRNECLSRLGGAVLGYDGVYRRQLFDEVRAVVAQYFDSGAVSRLLPAAIRVRALATQTGRLDSLMMLAATYNNIGAWTRLERLGWERGRLAIRAHARLAYRTGRPVVFLRRGSHVYLDPSVCGPDVPLDVRDVTDELARQRADVVVKNRDNAVELFMPATTECRVVRVGRSRNGELVDISHLITAYVDPAHAFGDTPLERGVWDVFVRLQMFGWTRNVRLGCNRAASAATITILPGIVGPYRTVAVPYWTTPYNNLSIGIDDAGRTLAHALGETVFSATAHRLTNELDLTIRTPVVLGPDVGTLHGRLDLTEDRTGVGVQVTASLRRSGSDPGTAVLRARVPHTCRSSGVALTAGRWRMVFVANPTATPGGCGAELRIPVRAWLYPGARLRANVVSTSAPDGASRSLRERVVRRIPQRLRRRIRTLLRTPPRSPRS
jgi:poly(ribitol-phosphate) beta-N-acetylglucosaminyltransferase